MNFHVPTSVDELLQTYTGARLRLYSGVTPPDKPRRIIEPRPQSHRPDYVILVPTPPPLPFVRPESVVQKRVRDVIDLVRSRANDMPDAGLWSDILDQVSAKYGVTRAAINSDRRSSDIVPARYEAMYRMSKEAHMSSPAIGRRMGNKDHTTVLYGIKKHAERMARR